MRKTIHPFGSAFRGKSPEQKSVGGARPVVQAASQVLGRSDVPMLATRIYAPGSLQGYSDSDPRFEGKSDAVENIYLPAPVEAKPRSGIAQAFNWLLTGRLA